jgi:hypothetical protein
MRYNKRKDAQVFNPARSSDPASGARAHPQLLSNISRSAPSTTPSPIKVGGIAAVDRHDDVECCVHLRLWADISVDDSIDPGAERVLPRPDRAVEVNVVCLFTDAVGRRHELVDKHRAVGVKQSNEALRIRHLLWQRITGNGNHSFDCICRL